MANETKVGQLVIDLKIKTEALEKGLETAKQKLQEIEQNNKQVENSNKSLDASYLAMSATAVLALGKIVGIIKECIDEYNSYTQAMSSLQNVSEYTGQSMQDFGNIMSKFGSYMTKADLATTIKNFSLMGFTAEQTEQMIEALTNSAIRNRNANYTVSEAVRVASEGYRQGLSTLSDSAGVTENLSVMLDNYARSIGKTASQLTDAEKNQAYLNRTMYAAEPFASAMSDYMDTLAGKQGQYSQAMRETQVAYAEALEPVMSKMLEGGTETLNLLNSLISQNPTLTAGMTTFAITLTTVTVALVALSKAKKAYAEATGVATLSTKAFTTALLSNPIFVIAATIATVISGISMLCSAIKENEEAQTKLNEVTETYKELQEGTYGYTDKNISDMEKRKSDIEEQIELYKKLTEAQQSYYNELNNSDSDQGFWQKLWGNLTQNISGTNKDIEEQKKKLNEARKSSANYGNSLEELNKRLEETSKYLDEANAIKKISKGLDTETIKKQQQEAAQLKINADQMQEYLNIVRNGNESTTEYQNAVKALAQAYPEAANAEGIIIEQAQNLINAEKLKADTAWNTSKETIQSYIDIINAALQSESTQRQIAQNIGISYEELTPKLQSVLSLLQTMAGYQATDVPNVTPVSISKPKTTSSSSTYSNKKLDNYKKEIEHKKALDQISIKEEIQMYEYALRNYAKTSAEKMELREKIYDLNKELANKEKDILDQQTEDYENYIQDVKNARGSAYDIVEQTADYNKIIQMHKNYLNQIMKDERLSLDERKDIYREELNTIREHEQKKRDLRVEQIDNTVSQLTNAITKQLEEMQEKDKAFIDKQLEEVEKLKEARLNAINAEYDAKIEVIEKELEALDKAEQQKTRDEEDAEYDKKKRRLEELIAFEHDATTKANYQKELDKLVAEYQKTLDSRALEDKKEALNNQKELLQKEQDDKTQTVEDEADRQKELYNKQLEDLEDYYSKQIDKAQETAKKMLLNVEQNQDKILSLLKSYGDAYEITGQTLGEKLAQGINDGITSKIENIIQRVQNTINAGIENKIKEWTSGMYKYEAGSNKPQTQTFNVYQTNNIEQNPEMPSETYRKLNNVSEKLAEQLAGI
nr:MAG TPA: chromosome segregation ATPase [Caudoviricetes sp.]